MSKKIIIFILLILNLNNYLFSSNKNDKMRIAVLDFKPKGVANIILEMVSELIRTELLKTDSFIVIERKEMKAILKEHELQQSGLIKTDNAVKIGELLSTKKILIGTIGKIDKKYIINGKIIDIEKGVMEFAEKSICESENKLITAVEEFVYKINHKITGKVYKIKFEKESFKKEIGGSGNKIKIKLINIKENDSLSEKDYYIHIKIYLNFNFNKNIDYDNYYLGIHLETERGSLGTDTIKIKKDKKIYIYKGVLSERYFDPDAAYKLIKPYSLSVKLHKKTSKRGSRILLRSRSVTFKE